MNKILSALFLSLVFIAHSNSSADTSISAFAKVYPDNSSYATNVYGEFIVDYFNENLPWGSEVTLHLGFTKAEFNDGKLVDQADWTHKSSHVMPSIAAYKWGAKVEQLLYSRGSSSQLTRMNFVIEVKLPDGTRFLEQGHGPHRYLRVLRPELSQCSSTATEYCTLSIENF